MRSKLLALVLMAIVTHIAWLGATVEASDAWITVTPEATDEILANPGMGWETFLRTAEDDKNLPSWIPSTVHYARWGWGELEPQPQKINISLIDNVLQKTQAAGQKLAFRVMCCSPVRNRPYHPQWLSEVGGRIVETRFQGRGPVSVPDFDDSVVLKCQLDFIHRLGTRYDGHPDIDHVDLGSVGWWGEWHMSSADNATMPHPETQKKIVDAYLAAFKKTPLLMLIAGGPMLKYAVGHGTGWRADCLGDMGGFSKHWSHMRVSYPQMLTQAEAGDAWKHSPVAWETCWDLRKWVDEGWSLRFIFNYALALHGSSINNKSAPLPEGEQVRNELDRFLRRLGYRLVLKELKHPSEAKAGEKLALSMQWQNVGSAPCYRPYRLAYRLSDAHGFQKILVSKVTVNKWLPGSVELFTKEFFRQPADLPPGEIADVQDEIALPGDIPPGRYAFSVAVVGEQDEKPCVRLAIKGRTDEGWYPLSGLSISR